MIKEFVSSYEPLQKELLPLYELPEGRNIYEESLSATNRYFPQYVIELKGMADGSGVPFHEVFCTSAAWRTERRAIIFVRALIIMLSL